ECVLFSEFGLRIEVIPSETDPVKITGVYEHCSIGDTLSSSSVVKTADDDDKVSPILQYITLVHKYKTLFSHLEDK
ncbi:hypothetical protein L9F63_015407, partial [Diploptera punctata]